MRADEASYKDGEAAGAAGGGGVTNLLLPSDVVEGGGEEIVVSGVEMVGRIRRKRRVIEGKNRRSG